jgi:hypothetical protein
MSDHADFNEKARGSLREATARAERLIAESKQIQAECDALAELEQLGVESANQFVAVGLKDQRLKALRRAVLGV